MSAYKAWNQAVLDFLFHEERRDQPVFLYMDHQLLNKIGSNNELGTYEDFWKSVALGLNGKGFPHFLQDLLRRWQRNKNWITAVPDFVSPVIISVLAWTERAESERSYYEAFTTYLNQMGIACDARVLLRKLLLFFPLLHEWSNGRPKNLGILKLGHLYAYRYVGQVHYHALINPEERRKLDRVWCDSNLEPNKKLRREFLVDCILGHPKVKEWLPGLRRYFTHAQLDIRLAAQEIIWLDYQEWDGKTSWEPIPEQDPLEIPIQLKLCHLGTGEWAMRMYHVRHRGTFHFGIGGLALKGDIGSNGWSKWVEVLETRSTFLIEDLENLVGTRVPSFPEGEVEISNLSVRVLLPAHLVGIVGLELIEQADLKPNSRFEILYHKSNHAKINAWQDQGGAKEIVLEENGFQNWQLMTGNSARLKINLRALEREPVQKSVNPFRGGRKVGEGVYFLHGLPHVKSDASFISLARANPQDPVGLKIVPRKGANDIYDLVGNPDYRTNPLGDDYILCLGEEMWTLIVREHSPLPQFETDKAFSFDANGQVVKTSKGASHHFFIPGQNNRMYPPPNMTPFLGGAEPIPEGVDFMARLVLEADGNGKMLFGNLYRIMQQYAIDRVGRSLERPERGRARKKLSSMGCFLELPSSGCLQLSPAVVVFLPRNRISQRVLLVGAWMPAMLEAVYAFCKEKDNELCMTWVYQAEAYLPPLAQVSFQKPEYISAMLDFLNVQYGDRIVLDGYPSYSERLFRWMDSANWNPQPSLRSYYPAGSERILQEAYAFGKVDQLPVFPSLIREQEPLLGYYKYYWWESEDMGYECSGQVAPWKWLLDRGEPAIFRDSRNSNTLYLPLFPLPPGVERGLTLASGNTSKVVQTIWEGTTITLQQFDRITSSLRKELPRLLFGERARSDYQAYFQPLKYTFQSTSSHGEITE